MLLQDLFEQLTYGEFSQLSLAGTDGEGIEPDNWPAVVSHINLGLTELHKRFNIKTKTAQLQQYAAITSYQLEEDFTVSVGTSSPLYILDSTKPFKNTVLRIETVYDDIEEEFFPLNDENNEDTLITTAFDTFVVPEPSDTTTMTVTYRCNHARILVPDLNPLTYNVDIPESLLEPLLFYVAARAYSGVPALDGQNQGLEYLQKFEASIAKITELSLITNNNDSNQRIWINGWV